MGLDGSSGNLPHMDDLDHFRYAAHATERVKILFERYFEKKAQKEHCRRDKLGEFSLEYALSQVFSPKQEELFKKTGRPLIHQDRTGILQPNG